jgi:hypothetical protein
MKNTNNKEQRISKIRWSILERDLNKLIKRKKIKSILKIGNLKIMDFKKAR